MTRHEMLRKLKDYDTWIGGLSDKEIEVIRRQHGCPALFYQKFRRALEEPVVEEMTFGPDGKLTDVRYRDET